MPWSETAGALFFLWGIYTLKTQRLGCLESLIYTLTLHPVPDISLIVNNPFCVGENMVFNYRIDGLPGTEHPQYNFTKDGDPDPVKDGHPDQNNPFLYIGNGHGLRR